MSIQESIQIQVESRTAVDSIDKITAAFTALLNQVNGVQAATDKINKQIQSFKAPSSSSSETSKMLKEEDSMWKQFYKDRKADEAAWAAYRKVKQKEASDALKEIRQQEELMWSKRNAEKQGISALKEYNDSLNNTKSALNGADTATKNYRASVQDLASAAKVASEEVKKLSQTTFSKSFGTQEWVSNQEKALRLMTEMNNKVSGQIKKRNADEIAASNQRIKIAEQERQAKETQQTRYLYTIAEINAKSVALAQSAAQKRIKIDADAEAVRQQMLMKRERMELETAQRIAAAQDRIARYASLKNTFAVDSAKQAASIRDQLSWLDRLKKSLSEIQSVSRKVFDNFIKNPFSNPFKKVETGAKDAAKEIEKTSTSLNLFMRQFNTLMSFARNMKMLGLKLFGVFLTATKTIYDAGLKLNKFRTTMTVVTGSTAAANDELEWLRDTSMKLGMDFQAASVPFAKFAAAAKNMFNRDEIRTIFTEFSKASVALHLTQAEIQGVFYALQQMASKGRVSSEELRRQLGERIPGAMTLAAKSMKMTMQELDAQLKKGAVSSQDFMVKYAEEIGKFFEKGAEYAANSTIGALNRLKNVWGFFLQDIADDKAFDAIKNIFNALSDKVVDLRKIMSDSGSRIAVIFNDIAKSIQNVSAEDIAGIFESMIESSRMLVSMLPAISANILSIVNEIASLPEYLTSIDAILNRMGGHKIIFSELQGLERYKQIVTDIKKVENETGMSEGRAYNILNQSSNELKGNYQVSLVTDKMKADAEKFRELLEDKGHTLEVLNTKFNTTTETANNYANGIVSINDVTGKNIVSMKEAAHVIQNYENVLSDANFALTKLPEDLQNASVIKTELELKKEALDLAKQGIERAEKELATARAKSALYENQVSQYEEMNRLGMDMTTEQRRAFTEAGNAANTLRINTEKRVAANAQLAKAQQDYNEELQKSIDKVNSLSLGQRKLLAQVTSLSDKAEDALTVAPTITDDQTYITRLNQLAQTRIALDDLYQKELEYKKLLSGKQLSEGQLDKYRTQIQEASAAQGNLLRDQSTLREQLKEYSIDAQKYAENLKEFFNAQNAKSATAEIENQYTLFKEQLDIIELQQGALGKVNALEAFRTKANQEVLSLNKQLSSQTETRTALEASLNSLQKQREEIIRNEGLESLKLIGLDETTLATQKIINGLTTEEVQYKKESNKWVELSKEAEEERLKTIQQIALAYAGIVYDNQQGFQSLLQGDYNTELDTWYKLYEAIGKTKEEIKKVYEQKRLIEFFNEAGLSVNALSESLADTFTSIIKDGGSFMDKLGDMWDAMIDRMLEASMRLVMDNAFALLTSWGEKGSWAQLGLGLVGVGASYLFGGDRAPKREDISESKTTTSGDDRALGFMEMVATDIAARDYFYAEQLAAFKVLSSTLQKSVSDLITAPSQYWSSILTPIFTPIKTAFTSMFPTLSKTISGVADVIGKTVTTFTTPFSTITDAISTSISSALGLTTTVAGQPSQVLSSSQDLAAMFGHDLGGALGSAETGLTAFTDSTTNATSSMSSAFTALSAVVGVVTTAFNSFSLAEGWDSLSGSQRVVGVAGAVGGAVSAAAGIASLAGFAGLAGILGPIGIIIAVGALLASFFTKPKVPKISGNTIFSEWMGGGTPPPGSGDLKYKPIEQDPNILYASKQGRYATVTPFGRRTIEPRHFKFEDGEPLIQLMQQVNRVDNFLADTLNQIDKNQGKEAINRWGQSVGETMDAYTKITLELLQSGEYAWKYKEKAKNFESADFLSSMYKRTSDLLAETGTATGIAFDKWFDFFIDKFGSENTLSLVAGVTANLENLMELPLSLVDLLRDNVKSVELGGTPEDAVNEMTNVIASYTLLKEGLAGLGETDLTGEQIVSFLGDLNGIGFAVENAASSLYEYGAALKSMDEDISDGIIRLIEYGKAQNFTNTQFSNFITSAGAFVSLGQALNLSAPLEDLADFAQIVGDLAKKTLDQAELKSLEDQAVEYGGLTVTEARAEIEKLGLATADAILQVVNEFSLVDKALRLTSRSLYELGVSLLDAIEGSRKLVEMAGGIEALESSLNSFFTNFYSQSEQLDVLTKDLLAQFNQLNVNLPATREGFRSLVAAQDLTTESGQKTYVALLSMSEQMANFYGGLEQVNQAAQDATQQIYNLAQAEKDRAATVEATLSKSRNYGLPVSELQAELNAISDTFTQFVIAIFNEGGSFDNISAVVADAQRAAQSALDSVVSESIDKFTLDNVELDYSSVIESLFNQLSNSDNANEQIAIANDIFDLIKDRYQYEQDALRDVASLIDNIKNTAKSFKVDDALSAFSNEGRLDEASSQFYSILRAANAGDLDAAGNLSDSAREYLTEARDFYASSPEYVEIFNAVVSALESFEAQAPQSLAQDDLTLLNNTNIGDVLQGQYGDEMFGFMSRIESFMNAAQGLETFNTNPTNDLINTGFSEQEISAIGESRLSLVDSLNSLLEAGKVDESVIEAVKVQNESMLIDLQALTSEGDLLSKTAADFFVMQQQTLSSLSEAFETGMITSEQTEAIYIESQAFTSSLLAAIQSGVISESGFIEIASASEMLTQGLIATLMESDFDPQQKEAILAGYQGLGESLLSVGTSLYFNDDQKAEIYDAITASAGRINELFASLDYSELDIQHVVNGLAHMVNSVSAELHGVTLTPDNVASIGAGLSALSMNTEAIIGSLGLSQEDVKLFTLGFGSAMTNAQDALQQLTLTDAQKSIVQSGVDAYLSNTFKDMQAVKSEILAILNSGEANPFALYDQLQGTGASLTDVVSLFSESTGSLKDVSRQDVDAWLQATGLPEFSGLGGNISGISQAMRVLNSDETDLFQIYNQLKSTGLSLNTIEQIMPYSTGAFSSVNRADIDQWLNEANLPRFKDGGIASGPISGYPVELHGTEAVIPLSSGSIPVEIRDNDNSANTEQIVNAIVESARSNAKGQAALKDELVASREEIRMLSRRIEALEAS